MQAATNSSNWHFTRTLLWLAMQWGLDSGLPKQQGEDLSAWLGCHLWNTKKKDILSKGLLCIYSKSKGSYKTPRKISQTHQKAVWGSEQLTTQVLRSCSNIVLTAPLGHFYRSSWDCGASILLHASLDTGPCSIPFPEVRKKAEKKGKKLLFRVEFWFSSFILLLQLWSQVLLL